MVNEQIVGRAAELAALDRVLDAANGTTAPMLLLSGEPGIGKTRLLAELTARAEARDFLVFTGRAAEFESELPMGVFVDAMDAYLASQTTLTALRGERLDELAAVFPALASSGSGQGAALQEERFRTVYAIRALLEHMARRAPIVLALDDVHWADPASLEAIMQLARRRVGAPVVFALALRPAHAPAKIVRALSAMADQPGDERLQLVPLSRSEAEPLLAGVADRDEIYAESGGNPFYLTELARYVSLDQPPRGTNLPERVAAALADEVDRLSPASQVAVKAAALVAERFDPDRLAAASGLSISDSFAAVDELIAADLVRTTEVPSEFRFRHPLVRSAVYETAEPGWRLAAHRRLATWLTAQSAPPTLIAPHIERSARPGDQDAINVLKAAGEATHVRAPAIAAHWYESALRLEQSDSGRADLLMPLAISLGASGRLRDSLTMIDQALRLLPGKAGVRLTAFCAALEHLLGMHVEAHERLLNALRDLDDDASAETAALQLELSVDALYGSQFEEMVVRGLAALQAARASGDRALTSAAAAMVGFGHISCARVHPANQFLDESAALLDGLGDRAVAGQLDAPFYLGWAEMAAGRFPGSIRHLERGLAVARQTGAGYLYGPTTIGLSHALAETGRLAEAIEHAQHAVDSARLADNPQGLLFALAPLAWWTAQSGDLPAALAAGQEAVEIGQAIGTHTLTTMAGWMLAFTALEAGDPQRCIDLILAECGGPTLWRLAGDLTASCCEALTRAELALGNESEARRWADRAASYADASDMPLLDAYALSAQAAVQLAAADPSAATAALKSAEAADSVGARIYAARARILAGRALPLAGDTERAISELLTAEATLAECGARRWRAEAAQVLRDLGYRPPARQRRSSSGTHGLSARERDVAMLLALGKTNKQIGEQLFISVRTVETHVGRILAKIGVGSRAAAAAVLAREMS